MTLLIFHLVLSGFTFQGVDIGMAQKILEYHSKRYPNGTFHPHISLLFDPLTHIQINFRRVLSVWSRATVSLQESTCPSD